MPVSKYRNTKIISPDGKFDSKYEYEEWCRLKLLERGGVIRNLMRQVPYVLIPTIRTTAGTLKQITYYADFVYEENGIVCMVDTKGYETEVFKIKKRLLINQYVTEQRVFIERKKGKKDKIYQKSY